MIVECWRERICDAIADIHHEFDCRGASRRVLTRIEMTLERVPNGTWDRLAALDADVGGALMAMLRAKLLLVVAGAVPRNQDASALLAECQSMVDRYGKGKLH